MARGWWTAGCVGAFLGVAGGAFGAHALNGKIDPTLLPVWETGARYLLLHALGLLAIALAAERHPGEPGFTWAGRLFVAGMCLFTGSLWALVLSGQRILGAITPFGGLCFLAGWVILARSGRRVLP